MHSEFDLIKQLYNLRPRFLCVLAFIPKYQISNIIISSCVKLSLVCTRILSACPLISYVTTIALFIWVNLTLLTPYRVFVLSQYLSDLLFVLHFFKQIESQKLTWQKESKVGSLKNVTHSPGGGNVKVCVLCFCVLTNIIYCSLTGKYRCCYKSTRVK